ncbi:MAG: hypothetical protein ISR48_10730 [Alphaproteobacteria bacterium]|nr:hypothetical protein [Alphaproteobacteria bacterium]
MRKSVVPLMLAASLVGCTNYLENTPKGTTSALLGAVAGGAAGYFIGNGSGQFLAIALGTVFGGGAGYLTEVYLNNDDMAQMRATSQAALEDHRIGATGEWQNPETGHFGSITPTRTYRAEDGRVCRDFDQTVTIRDDIYEDSGTACRARDGSWFLASAEA